MRQQQGSSRSNSRSIYTMCCVAPSHTLTQAHTTRHRHVLIITAHAWSADRQHSQQVGLRPIGSQNSTGLLHSRGQPRSRCRPSPAAAPQRPRCPAKLRSAARSGRPAKERNNVQGSGIYEQAAPLEGQLRWCKVLRQLVPVCANGAELHARFIGAVVHRWPVMGSSTNIGLRIQHQMICMFVVDVAVSHQVGAMIWRSTAGLHSPSTALCYSLAT